MSADPAGQRLARTGFSLDQARCAQYSDEDLGVLDVADRRVDHLHRVTGEVDEQPLAALEALYTLLSASPRLARDEPIKMIAALSFSSGCAFCTVKKARRTLRSKILSKRSVSMPSSGVASARPALATMPSNLRPSVVIRKRRRADRSVVI
jgi:hypothetical protein